MRRLLINIAGVFSYLRVQLRAFYHSPHCTECGEHLPTSAHVEMRVPTTAGRAGFARGLWQMAFTAEPVLLCSMCKWIADRQAS